METFALLALIALLLKQLWTLAGVVKSFAFLRRNRVLLDSAVPNGPFVIIVIPLLCEQRAIGAALAHFATMRYTDFKIMVVSSEREGSRDSAGSTMERLGYLQSEYTFVWLHYPGVAGTKADQINYAVDHVAKCFPDCPPERTFIAVYDVDSRPDLRSFQCLAATLLNKCGTRVFQQSALFDVRSGQRAALKTLKRTLLRAGGVRATRFVLGYEIPRLLNRLAYYRKARVAASIGRMTYAHCVGHGLFVRLDLARLLRFPPGEILEDMFYGFLLNCAEEPVEPLPALDYADVPCRLSTIFLQMSRWYLGPSRTLTYYRYATQVLTRRNALARARILVLSGWWYAANWLLTSPLVLMAMLLTIFGAISPAKIAAVAFLTVYCATVVAAMLVQNWVVTSTNAERTYRVTLVEGGAILALYPLVLLTHSLPAWHCIADLLLRGGRGNRNRKTEHV